MRVVCGLASGYGVFRYVIEHGGRPSQALGLAIISGALTAAILTLLFFGRERGPR